MAAEGLEAQSIGCASDKDSVSSDREHSTTTGDHKTTEESFDEREQAEREIESLAKTTTSRIRIARWVAFALIIATGAFLSYFTYSMLQTEENESYEEGVS